jgi:hypothetical protein
MGSNFYSLLSTMTTPISATKRKIKKAGISTRFQNTAGTLDNHLKRGCIMNKEKRKKLGEKERLAFHAACVTPLDPKFSIKVDLSSLQAGTTTGDYMSKNLSFALQVK